MSFSSIECGPLHVEAWARKEPRLVQLCSENDSLRVLRDVKSGQALLGCAGAGSRRPGWHGGIGAACAAWALPRAPPHTAKSPACGFDPPRNPRRALQQWGCCRRAPPLPAASAALHGAAQALEVHPPLTPAAAHLACCLPALQHPVQAVPRLGPEVCTRRCERHSRAHGAGQPPAPPLPLDHL